MTPAPLDREPIHIPRVLLYKPDPPHRPPHIPVENPPSENGREERPKPHWQVAQSRLDRVEAVVVLEPDGEGGEDGVHAGEDHAGVQEEGGDVGLEERLDRRERVVGFFGRALDERVGGERAVGVAAWVALLHGDLPLVVRAARGGWRGDGTVANEGAKRLGHGAATEEVAGERTGCVAGSSRWSRSKRRTR